MRMELLGPVRACADDGAPIEVGGVMLRYDARAETYIAKVTEFGDAPPADARPLMLGATDFDNLQVRAGRLGDAEILYDNPEVDFSPSNFWAEDRSWVICTDYDLWATKVAGPASLIDALLKDSEIEAVRLPWAP
ncbi:hypothetical protein [Nonomuraea sp. NPDC052265]|uniref:hypothetical protein n=1 Tax=Nonomuraea sp. NPDC052265 TaxID=3364374 RepID=UPI0037C7D922